LIRLPIENATSGLTLDSPWSGDRLKDPQRIILGLKDSPASFSSLSCDCELMSYRFASY